MQSSIDNQVLQARPLHDLKTVVPLSVADIVEICSTHRGMKPFGSQGLHPSDIDLIARVRDGTYYALDYSLNPNVKGNVIMAGIPVNGECAFCHDSRAMQYSQLGASD